MVRVSVTGASGFIGRHAVAALAQAGCHVRACVRGRDVLPGVSDYAHINDLLDPGDVASITNGAEVVLHIAGSAHSKARGAAEMRRVNVEGTKRVAQAAVEAGVRRFVFVSSIGVSGSSASGRLTEDSPCSPADHYAQTKLEAEQHLRGMRRSGSMELVVVRPTLVAGAGAPGSLNRIATFIGRGWPLPQLGAAPLRHLIGIRSLADLLVLASTHPAAGDRLFLAADEPALSLVDIANEIAAGMGSTARFLRVPATVVSGVATMLGRRRDLVRLRAPLLVDASSARQILGWRSKTSIQEELRALGGAARCSPSNSRK